MADLFNFLHQYTSPKKNYLLGFVPPLSTLVCLTALAAIFAFAPLVWAGIAITAPTYFSWLAYSFVGVIGTSLLNFWFSREVQYYTLGATDVQVDTKFGKDEIDLISLVNQLRQELNASEGTLDPNHPNHLRMPRIATFKEHHPKIVPVPGRNMGRSAIYISTGLLELNHNHIDQKHLAALLMPELYQIKRKRSWNDLILGIGHELSNTMNNLMFSQNLLLKGLGYMLVPFKMVFMIHNALARSYVYEAARHVISCGRGNDYLAALDQLKNPKLVSKGSRHTPVPDNLKGAVKAKRDPYQGNRFIKYLADYIDEKEFTTDDKFKSSRWASLPDILLREGAWLLKELSAIKPSNNKLKAYIKQCLADPKIDQKKYRIPETDIYGPIDFDLNQKKLDSYFQVRRSAAPYLIPRAVDDAQPAANQQPEPERNNRRRSRRA